MDGTAARPQHDVTARLTPGALVAGRYLVGERLGAGASAEVLAALDLATDGHVALKSLRDGIDDSCGAASWRRRASSPSWTTRTCSPCSTRGWTAGCRTW